MQDYNGNGDGTHDAPLEGEIVEVCAVQRDNEPYPCTHPEPCPVHCGAKTRVERGGRKCTNYAMPNGRCRMHARNTPKGIGSPQYKGKGRSRYSPRASKTPTNAPWPKAPALQRTARS